MTDTPMAAQRPGRIDLTYPEPLVERIEYLAERNDESRSAVMLRAMTIGIATLESELSQYLSFRNQLAVSEKLKRRGAEWEEAMAILEAGTDEMKMIAKKLRRSAGGE